MTAVARALLIVADSRVRGEWLIRRQRPDNLFQPSGHTWVDRYQVFFEFVRDRLADVPQPRLLSFGCSTGEEVFNLRHWFPNAEIVGVDINRSSIAVARARAQKIGETGIVFMEAASARGQPDEHYDAIFCMAVFRHGDLEASRPESCAGWIAFADFDRTVAGLDRCLKPGGYLVMRHSHFRFEDTGIFTGYEPVYRHVNRRGPPLLYGSDNHRVESGVGQDVVFRKRQCQPG